MKQTETTKSYREENLTNIRRQYCMFLVEYILRTEGTTKNLMCLSVVSLLTVTLYYYFETMLCILWDKTNQ